MPVPAAIALPRTLSELLDEAVASSQGRLPFLGVRTSSTRSVSLTMAEFGAAVGNAASMAAAVEPAPGRVTGRAGSRVCRSAVRGQSRTSSSSRSTSG